MREDTPEARAAFEVHKSIAAGTFPRMKEVTDLERLYSELVVRAGYEAWLRTEEIRSTTG